MFPRNVILMAVCLLVSAGCTTPVPVTVVALPSPPQTLMEPPPPRLEQIPGDRDQPVTVTAAAKTVATNYGTYHLIAERLRALQQWVREQAALGNAAGSP